VEGVEQALPRVEIGGVLGEDLMVDREGEAGVVLGEIDTGELGFDPQVRALAEADLLGNCPF